jgi:RNA polymerase sigma factor (sigma-70 family)
MRDDPAVIALVYRAAAGDQGAWNEIVERYVQLVWSICQRYQLDRQDIDDVGQTVWLLLVEKISTLREPAALPGWLRTTTHRECLRVLAAARRHDHAELLPEVHLPPDPGAPPVEEEILAAERDAQLRAAFAELPRTCRELLAMMVCDPPCRYEDISASLGIPIGSIGPTRARCLQRLRRSSHLSDIAGATSQDTGVEQERGAQ